MGGKISVSSGPDSRSHEFVPWSSLLAYRSSSAAEDLPEFLPASFLHADDPPTNPGVTNRYFVRPSVGVLSIMYSAHLHFVLFLVVLCSCLHSYFLLSYPVFESYTQMFVSSFHWKVSNDCVCFSVMPYVRQPYSMLGFLNLCCSIYLRVRILGTTILTMLLWCVLVNC